MGRLEIPCRSWILPPILKLSNYPKTMKYYPKGYSIAPAFASPDYSKNEIKKCGYPDKRSTLYWNGNIRTDRNGKASVNFFIDDSKTTYTVTMESITGNGMLIYKKSKINRQLVEEESKQHQLLNEEGPALGKAEVVILQNLQ
jgi:hypothetical protein